MSSRSGATLVTGASRRIGQALATGLLKSGESVVAHSRIWNDSKVSSFSEAACAKVGVRWHPWEADFESSRLPPLPDVPISHLVLNASMFERGEPWNTLTSTVNEASLISRHLQVNVLAQWELAIAVAARGHLESVVMILDTYYDRPLPGYSAYQVSKAAGAGLVRALASELTPIRVNGVAPGTVLWSDRSEEDRAEAVNGAVSRTVLARVGVVDDVVGAVKYLRDAPYLTGEIIRVDGGRWKP